MCAVPNNVLNGWVHVENDEELTRHDASYDYVSARNVYVYESVVYNSYCP